MLRIPPKNGKNSTFRHVAPDALFGHDSKGDQPLFENSQIGQAFLSPLGQLRNGDRVILLFTLDENLGPGHGFEARQPLSDTVEIFAGNLVPAERVYQLKPADPPGWPSRVVGCLLYREGNLAALKVSLRGLRNMAWGGPGGVAGNLSAGLVLGHGQ